jgi:hypothetical protein
MVSAGVELAMSIKLMVLVIFSRPASSIRSGAEGSNEGEAVV